MITISHIIQPFVNSVLKYSVTPGKHVPTFQHPEGIPMQIKIAPLIADLEASRKASGFMAHGATFFCSICLCTSNQVEDLNLQSWTLRKGAEVWEQAQVWLNIATKGGREVQAQATGVRWSPLHSLPYWDPVKHVMLGFMHNWLEGILKHQLHMLWGIGPEETQKVDEEIKSGLMQMYLSLQVSLMTYFKRQLRPQQWQQQLRLWLMQRCRIYHLPHHLLH
jgi:hypothetical protein